MIKIVVDSTAYVPREYLEQHGIAMAPQFTHLDDVQTQEGTPGEFDEYFGRLINTKSFPSTSQPTTESFFECYKKIVESGNEVICITSSSGISGTFNGACAAVKMLDKKYWDMVSVIDSRNMCQLIWVLIKEMVRLIDEGKSRAEVVAAIEDEKQRGRAFFTAKTLEYLKRGGRLSGASAFFGKLLDIKPIIDTKGGVLKPFKKVRGIRKTAETMVENIPADAYNIGTAYVYHRDENLEYLNELLEKKFPGVPKALNMEIGPVIGSHIGPYGFGVLFFDPKQKKEI